MTNRSSCYPCDALHIWAENEPVDKYNESKLEMIKRPRVTLIIAHDEYPAMASQHDVQKDLSSNRSETGGLDNKIKLKQDARVMLTTNLNIEDCLINSQMGTVSKIKYSDTSLKPQVTYIKFDDESAGLGTIRKSGDLYAMENHTVPIVPVVAKIKVKTSRPSSSEIKRTRYPLALAWACTIHKVQGLTLSTVVFSFELYKQKQFNYGQVYVALTRVKSLEQLYIFGEIDPKHIRADPRVHKEHERVRCRDLQACIPDIMTSCAAANDTFSFTLLNVRFLRKHCTDLKFDLGITCCDVLALTETCLKPSETNEFTEEHLDAFRNTRRDNNNDFLSLAFCTKITVQCSRHLFIKKQEAPRSIMGRRAMGP